MHNRIKELQLMIANKERQGLDTLVEKARLDELIKWKHNISILKQL